MKHTLKNALELLRHLAVSFLAALVALGPAPLVFADVVSGDPRVQPRAGSTQVWDITFRDGAIIRYRSFDVGRDQVANFIPTTGANSRVLNRITTATPTRIDGTITGSGRIYIVNPAGVFFGSTAKVDVTAMQAIAGNLSDRDFKNGDDHFTNLKGRVENEGSLGYSSDPDASDTIVSNAISLVGRNVVNTGRIGADGWVVMAAGRDVFIGRDTNGNGLLLRVEGGADAVFNKKATGVKNTGDITVEALPPATPTNPNPVVGPAGRISLGAGDLYGTAIFNTGAIKAREIAMQASNKGDVALAGTVQSETLDIAFGGDKNGSLRSAAGSAPQTLNADTVNLTATSAKGEVNVADRFLLRGQNGGTTANLNVEAKAVLKTSKLANLTVAVPTDTTPRTKIDLASPLAVDIDDKQLVTGSQLTIEAPSTAIRGTDGLVVERFEAKGSRLVQTEGDIVATGQDGSHQEADPNNPSGPKLTVWDPVLRVTGNVELMTKPGGLATRGTTLSAKNGTLSTVGDVTASDGGGIRIEAADVKLGSLNSDGTLTGGSILSLGNTAPSSVTIVADNQGLDPRLTGSVQAKSIITQAAPQVAGLQTAAGGDVTIDAPGDVHLFGDVLTQGGPGLHTDSPTNDGGSVRIHAGAGKTLTVNSIVTGGGDAPKNGASREHGEILLSAGKIVLQGSRGLSATAGDADNAKGERNRSVTLDGPVTLDTDATTIQGGAVEVTGNITEGQKLEDPQDPNSLVDRAVDLSFQTGPLTLGGSAEVKNLRIATVGPGPVLFGGNVSADESVRLTFDTAGVARWGTTGTSPVTVTADRVEVTAGNPSGTLVAAASTLSLDPTLHFKLTDPPTDSGDPHKSFAFWQAGAIDQATTDALFTPGRFVDGTAGLTLLLRSNGSLSFSQNALDDVLGSDLKLIGDSFVALPGPAARTVFDVDSFELTTLGRLDADFDVIARGTRDDQGIALHSGATGIGHLDVMGNLRGRTILLVAGDADPENGQSTASITIADTAHFGNTADTAAPDVFGLQQDASLGSSSLPALSHFAGGSIAGSEVRLESTDGAVTLETGAAAALKGTDLVLNGETGLNLGSEALELTGLVAKTKVDLDVSAPITITSPDGGIDLSAGLGTAGNLTVDAALTANTIDLRAGAGIGGNSSHILLQSDAKFAGVSATTPVAPTHFGMIQDASLTVNDLPSVNDFAGSLAGKELELRSLGGSVSVSSPGTGSSTPGLIDGTALTLEGRGQGGVNITVADSHAVGLQSLEALGPVTLNGSITTVGDLSIDTTLNDVTGLVTLNAPATDSLATNQMLFAGGALTVVGKIQKTTDGHIRLTSGAGKALEIGDVETAHAGGGIAVVGGAGVGTALVKTGTLDASGSAPTDPTGLAVSVTGTGAVEVAGIKARGAGGANGKDGERGGDVEVSGATLRVGTVDASGGNGGSVSGVVTTTHGGDAGSIALAGSEVGILGDLLAIGGAGGTRGTNTPLADLRGAANDVGVTGSLLLLAKREDGPTNAIHGRNVTITGAVLPGREKLDENAAETDIAPSSTGLRVVAENDLDIGGDITAGELDLEVHHGPLDLGPKTIHSDRIRLAASDGPVADPNNPDGVVQNVDQLTLRGANGTRRILSLTLEQDQSFGAGGSAIPDARTFGGTVDPAVDPAVGLGLISQNGTVTLDAAHFANVAGTRLTLAANGAGAPININGDPADATGLALESLQLGTAIGVDGSVGGNTNVIGNLRVGGTGPFKGPGIEVLRSYGNLTVNGDAHILGVANFAGSDTQTLDVRGGVLELAGSRTAKNTTGDLHIDADRIDLTAATAQSISNDGGRLVIGAPLVKRGLEDTDGNGRPDAVGSLGLLLGGISSSADQPAVVVSGTTQDPLGSGDYAIAVGNGNLTIRASLRDPSSTTNAVGSYELSGDVLAFGDVTLEGKGSFVGGKPLYTVAALRNPFLGPDERTSGELTMGGVSSASGDLHLIARGDDPSADVPHPAGIHLNGNFANLAGALELDGSVDFAGDTTIDAAGDVSFDSQVQGEHGLTVTSGGQLALFDDVAMTAGALSLSGDSGVRFVSTSDSQFIQADSISLGSGAARNPSGAATLVRNGNLSLRANKGDVAIANGQRMVVNGSLDVSAPKRISLDDTAADRITLVSHDLIVRSGSTVMANSIVSSARPRVTSNGIATFAVPTRVEVSDNIPSDEILLRQIHPDGSPLSLAGAFADPDVIFPTVPFPVVNGPAQFDYAAETPLPPVRQALTRPHVDAREFDASLVYRPLWAEELLAYLEERSIETPGVSESVEHLPPVGARPGDSLAPEDRRVRSSAAEQAVTLYRELFRPNIARDPETGFIDQPGRAAAIRAAFQEPIDALRRGNGGKPVSGSALRELIASTPSFTAAQGYGAQLGQLVAAGELALTPDQKPRFRALVLSEVTPYGIAPAEFATALQ